MDTKAIYITWTEETAVNPVQEYTGGGCYHTTWEYKQITKRARWSSEVTCEQLARAKQYIAENMQDDRQNVRAVIVEDKP
jgi:hypothetical protein